jgi:dTDP-4-amino-4,6-dideoxygalactose transaminase
LENMNWKVPLFKSYWDDSDIDAISEVIKRGTYWATGPEIQEFENRIADYVGRKYCVSFNSGTSALHSLLLAYNLKSSEIIVPSFTFISTTNAVLLIGAKPVFAETESKNYGLDVESVKQKISKKTKAIITIHYGGLPSQDTMALKELAESKDILLIEDAAESFGSKTNNKMAGSFGDAAMFSLCQNKVITTGEGGLIVTDSKGIYKKMKLVRSHGRVEEKGYDYFSTTKELDYIDIGYNFRMSTMTAALGLSQLEKVDEVIKMRREKAFFYNKKLAEIDEIILPHETQDQKHVYQMYTIQLKDSKLRDDLQKYLTDKGIMSKVYFHPIHLKSYYKHNFGFEKGYLPKTEKLSEKVLTLPLYASMPEKELNYVAESVKSYFGED